MAATPRNELWAVTDHVCQACFGRVLSRPLGDGQNRAYRCSNCGATGDGRSPSVICACGMKLKGGRLMGLHCVPNSAPTPEFPAQVIAEGGGVPATRREPEPDS